MANECSMLVMLHERLFLFVDDFCLLLIVVRCKEEKFLSYIDTYICDYISI